jgi:hypothetical protein
MVGLDAAGKTTILYKLKLGEGQSSQKLLIVYSLFWMPPLKFVLVTVFLSILQSLPPFRPLVSVRISFSVTVVICAHSHGWIMPPLLTIHCV